MNSAVEAVRVAAEGEATRPGILTVQGCSGCKRPRKTKIKTPFGTRSVFSRLKMTRIPDMLDVLPQQASGTVPLCKTCRRQAQDAA